MANLFDASKEPLKYASVPTRYFTADSFLGDAVADDSHSPMALKPGEIAEDLQKRFASGTCATSLPSCYGPPKIKRSLAGNGFDLDNEIASWMRNGGLPVR